MKQIFKNKTKVKFMAILLLILFLSVINIVKQNIRTETRKKPIKESKIIKTKSKSFIGKRAANIDLDKLKDEDKVMKCNDILSNPSKYIGKIIKVKGKVSNFYDNKKDKTYTYITISTNESKSGIEFNSSDVVKEGDIVTIKGTLTTYIENNETHIHIENGKLI